LHIACSFKDIPLIVALLKRGADLHNQDPYKETPYSSLAKEESKRVFFAVREAFNNRSCLQQPALIGMIVDQHLVSDLKRHIMKIYLENFFETPEAKLWGPIAVDAYKMIDPKETDQKRCLTKIVLMKQEEKTKMNIAYTLADKK